MTIFNSLELLKNELNIYCNNDKDLAQLSQNLPLQVILDNVALVESPAHSNTMNDSIIISVVNINEEATLKNTPHFRKLPDTNSVRYENPPVFLNLFLLFSSHFKSYENALKYLSAIIRFFQGKNQFKLNNDTDNLYLIMDLYSMTFEQLNHLWGSLGGKQMPSVMYKVRLVSITDNKQTGSGRLIEEVASKENVN